MLLVPDRPARAERALTAGELACPDCRGELRPWGWARRRPLRDADTVRLLRPRRSRCRVCQATHVLLPTIVLPQRAYAVTVIGAALLAAARGQGHRGIAAELGVPTATVRGWLRRLRARAEDLAVYCTRAAYRFDAGLGRLQQPGGWPSPVHAAVALLGVAAAAYERFSGASSQGRWQLACVVTSGLLLANTSRPYPTLW